jgi:2-polyprenyl-3-methyl-5-hydroxy-6-metoxy-1,4-benzoquinol methylase
LAKIISPVPAVNNYVSAINEGANYMNTDSEWEKWGKQDPYYGVLTHEKFRSQNLTDEAKKEFFESGKRDVHHLLEVCRSRIDQGFLPRKVLDFGCGVGRVLIPLGAVANHVVGLDVSESMLKEARKNCNEYDVRNVSLLKSDDDLSQLTGCFDLIHSCIVFQHIPIERGMCIFTNLLSHLEEGGICAIQFTYSRTVYGKTYEMRPVEQPLTISLYPATNARWLPDSPRSAACKDPEMQMNYYNLNELFFQIQSAGIHDLHLEYTDHGGELGVFLYFQKPRQR